MKTPARLRLLSPRRGFAVLAAFTVSAAVHAQFVVAPPPQALPAASSTSASGSTGANGKSKAAPSDVESAIPSGLPLVRRGPVSVRPHFLYRILEGNGVQTSALQPADTLIQQISPGLLVELGTHVHIDYTPTWSLYSDPLFEDTIDQYVSAVASTTLRDWTFDLSQRYASASPSLIETGGPTHITTYTGELTAGYKLGDRTFLSASVSRNTRTAEAFTNSREWSTSEWLEYRISPQLSFSAGFAYGTAEVSASPSIGYTRPQARLTWLPTAKIRLMLEGGVERRKFSGIDGSLSNPVYDARLAYSPFRVTTVSLGATRKQTDSYFSNQATKSHGATVELEQRILRHYFVSASVAKTTTTYLDVVPGFFAGRRDRNWLYGLRVSRPVLRQGTIALFVHKGENSSNDNDYSFDTRQIGFEFGYRF